MRVHFFALLGLLTLAAPAWGQSAPLGSGLYKSAEDFRARRLTLAVDCKTEKHKLRLHEFSGQPYVTVKHGGQDYRMAKDSLFGFRDCDGREFRFATDHLHYPILNPAEELLIYKLEQPAIGKNQGYVRLFFSVNAAAPIQSLTLIGVKKAFPDNHRFHDLLDAQFREGGDLTAFDTMHGMTKLNWLLRQSRTSAGARPGDPAR
jgi:hypothetical protein